MEKEEPLLFKLINDTFNKGTIEIIRQNYIYDLKDVSKWICYSDYCLDDKTKKNSVVTFSILPFIDDQNILATYINIAQKKDIKKTKVVNEEFLKFLKNYPVINFSFILDNRKTLLGNSGEERKQIVLQHLNHYKEIYIAWGNNEPNKKSIYKPILKEIESSIREVSQGKKVNLYIDVLLFSFLGAYVSSILLKEIDKNEVFGWMSDRDKLFEVGNGLILHLFHNTLHSLLPEDKKNFVFTGAMANSSFNIFYDEFIKIPDYIVGTLADYNLEENSISHEKFNTVLTKFMGDNSVNNFVFKIFKSDLEKFNCAKIEIKNR